MKKILAFCLWLAASGPAYQAVFAQAATSAASGVYSAAQADRGKATYGSLCASCHGATLAGGGPMPALTGDGFQGNWSDQTLADLVDKIQTTMPATSPGTLTRAQTAEIVAYILSANQFPAGSSDLPSDAASLKKIQVGKPPASGQKP